MTLVEFRKKLIFGYLTCQRLFPNYVYFSTRYNFGNPEIIRGYLTDIRKIIVSGTGDIEFKGHEKNIENVMPTPHEFESVLASSALDACAGIIELISFIQDKDISRIESISTLAKDSVDMYIQEKENLDISSPDFEAKIANHYLMKREIDIQKGILDFLSRFENINEEDLITLEKLQANNGLGNLDL